MGPTNHDHSLLTIGGVDACRRFNGVSLVLDLHHRSRRLVFQTCAPCCGEECTSSSLYAETALMLLYYYECDSPGPGPSSWAKYNEYKASHISQLLPQLRTYCTAFRCSSSTTSRTAEACGCIPPSTILLRLHYFKTFMEGLLLSAK